MHPTLRRRRPEPTFTYAVRPARLTWLTPPPFPSGLESVRPCAAAVRRVADARAMPVADLYTAFSGLPLRDRLFTRTQDLALAPRATATLALPPMLEEEDEAGQWWNWQHWWRGS